jgi:hypothetical protein
MNTNELILQLQRVCQFAKGRMDNWQVVIPVYRVGAVGGTPSVNIKIVRAGFDWDSGRIFIEPETRLREIDLFEIKMMQDKYEELGWTHYEISGLKKEIERLRKVVIELESKNESSN